MSDSSLRIAIVGAGVAGLTLAAALQAHGHTVTVFDEGRSPGGRCASLKTLAGAFDPGCAQLSGVSEAFRAQLARWCERGWLQAADDGRFLPQPTMGALMQHLAEGLEVQLDCFVAAVSPTAAGWQLRLADGREPAPFEAVLLALPPRHALPLLEADRALADQLRTATSRPVWTVCAAWPAALPFTHDHWQADDTRGPLQHARRLAHRPGRPRVGGMGDRWVLHASPEWSEHNRDVPPAHITQHLSAALARAFGVALARPTHASSHLWREAEVTQPLAATHAWHATRRLGACGDAWAAQAGVGGVERAWLSAQALAAAMTA